MGEVVSGIACNIDSPGEREFFIDNLLVRTHFIIVMIRWTGLAPWEFGFPFPGSLPRSVTPISTHRCQANMAQIRQTRPDSGLGFQVKVLKTFEVVPPSLGSGTQVAERTHSKSSEPRQKWPELEPLFMFSYRCVTRMPGIECNIDSSVVRSVLGAISSVPIVAFRE